MWTGHPWPGSQAEVLEETARLCGLSSQPSVDPKKNDALGFGKVRAKTLENLRICNPHI